MLLGLGLSALPPEIGELTALTRLDVSNNQLTGLPPKIGQLTALRALSIHNNPFTALPPEIGKLTALTALFAHDSQLTALPPEIGKLTALIDLIVSYNRLAALPPEIGKLTALRVLLANDNQLTALRPEIGQLTALTVLDVSGNQLTALPAEIGQLTALRALHLRKNHLIALPPEIGQLTAMTELSASNNKLTALPSEIGQLTALTALWLEHNQVTALPASLGQLTRLRTLKLDGNPLVDPPPAVVAQGIQAILAYLRGKLEARRPQWRAKLLVVGEGGVGKTCLLDALQNRPFNPQSETTRGIQIEPLELAHPARPGVNMTLSTWDFGGQQIYHATHQFFLSEGALFVLAFSARLGWQAGKLTEWLERIHSLAPGAPVLLAATHVDERLADLPYETLRKSFPQIVGLCPISNTEPRQGIAELRAALAAAAAGLPRMGQEWPADWVTAAEAVRARRAENHIDAAALLTTLADRGVSEESRPVLARALHELGDILYFADDEELHDTVLLDPEWVTRQVSKVLECAEIKAGLGLFRREHMTSVWADVNPTLRDRLLRLMERFDLSYRIPDDPQNKSLVVERLSQDPVAYEQCWTEFAGSNELAMTFDLGIRRPAGVPTWFIAREHRFTTNTHWLYGALFADHRDPAQCRHLGLMLAPPTEEKIVTLVVRGPSPYSFFNLLRDGLEWTLQRFKGLNVKRTVPCRGRRKGKPCPHEFDYRQLVACAERTPPKLTLDCPECLCAASVSELLFGIHFSTDDAVFEELRTLSQELREHDTRDTTDHEQQRAEHEQQLTAVAELRAYVQREFTKMFDREQRLLESHCPRVFSLRLIGLKDWPLPDKLIGRRWELQLYCEYPGCWHPMDGGRYEIKEPAKWLGTLAPHVARLVKVFRFVAPLVGPWLAVKLPDYEALLKNDIRLMEALAERLPKLEAEVDGISPDQLYGEGLTPEDWPKLGGRAPGETASLRALRALLEKLDAAQHWGGLAKVLTPEGQYLWLCEHHAMEFKR